MSTIIIMAGGTASGKTSIAAEFAQKHKCLIIHHDRYYKDILFPPDANFDEPDALDNTLLAEHLKNSKLEMQLSYPSTISQPIDDYGIPSECNLKT